MKRNADNTPGAADWLRAAFSLFAGWAISVVALPGCASLRREKVVPESVATCRQLSRQGVGAMERGDCGQARELLNRAVAIRPSDLEARRQLAEVLWQGGSKREALVHMEAAVRLDPQHAPTLVRSGEMLLELGLPDRALARAEDAIALDATLPEAWALRGRIFRQRGELDRALADLQQSLRHNPHDSGVLFDAAELEYQLGRPQRCLTTLHQLMDSFAVGEESRRALWLEGLAYGAVDRREDAVASLNAACRQGPPEPELLYQLAKAQNVAGHRDAAAATAREALAANGDHEPSRALLAQLEAGGTPGVDVPLRR